MFAVVRSNRARGHVAGTARGDLTFAAFSLAAAASSGAYLVAVNRLRADACTAARPA